ncbi:hypothetical protein DK756_09690 [Salmonella enterica subsp. enterica]|nr:hypothetical protein [Salmonella enterica subsp. enterica serovar Newport]
MPVLISGVLKDGTGTPVQNCTIQLKACRTSTTVVVNTVASENPDDAGRYSMDVEQGQYTVTLLVEGYPPSHAGVITVYDDSKPGTLNDFLGAMTEDDVRPEALRRFEAMVEEVARQASEASRNATAAGQASEQAQTSAGQASESATAAVNAAGAAEASATQAASSAASAESSAGTATTKAGEASASAASADTARTAAAASAAAAKTSEANADASRTAAGDSAAAAAASATEHPKPPRRRQKRRRLPVPVMQVRQPLRRQRRKRRQPHRQPQRKHLRQMQQRQQVQQRPAQQPPRHQHRRHPLTPPHLIPAHHWRRKAVLLPEQQPPEQKMPQNGQKISRT